MVAMVFPLLFFPLKTHHGVILYVPSSTGGYLTAGLEAYEWYLSRICAGGGSLSLSLFLSPF